MPDVEVTVTTTPIDVYINSDPTVYVNTATEGIQGPALDSGIFVQRSETGNFVSKSDTGNFVDKSETGIFIVKPNNPQENQFLNWNGQNWISKLISTTDIQGYVQPSPLPEGRLLPEEKSYADTVFWDGTNWIARKIQTNDLTGVVFLTGNQSISGNKTFLNTTYFGLSNNAYTLITSPGSFYLNNIISYGGYGGYGGYGYTTSPLIEFVNNSSFNLYGSGQTAIKFFEKLITGFTNISATNISATNILKSGYPVISTNETGTLLQNYFRLGGNTSSQVLTLGTVNNYDLNISTNNKTRLSVTKGGVIDIGGTGSEKILIDTTIKGFPQIRWSGAEAGKGSRLSSREGGGYYVTLDREDGTPENLNVAGNLQVGSGSGIRAERLYVHGSAVITNNLTVNNSGNFVSGLFVNRIPVLTGTSGTQSQINNLSIIANDSTIVRTTGNQTISGNKTFVGDVKIWDGISYGIDIQTNGTFNLDGAEGNIRLGDGVIQNFNDIYATNGHFSLLDGTSYLNGLITGYQNIYQGENRVIDSSQTGIFATTGGLLDLNIKIDSISGSLESMISGLSGFSESTYATKTEVAALSGIVTGNNYSLTEMINSLSGYADLNFATILNLNQTGELLLNQVNSLSGTITGSYATKQYVIDSISTLSGNLTFVNYKYILTSGYDSYEVTFPQPFVQAPRTIMVQMENEEYNIIYAYDVYNITSGGFSIKFSDILAETNNLMVLAKA